jgi:hypothetical protein
LMRSTMRIQKPLPIYMMICAINHQVAHEPVIGKDATK